MNNLNLAGFTDILGDEIDNSQESQPLSLSSEHSQTNNHAYENLNTVPLTNKTVHSARTRPAKGTGQHGQFRSVEEIEEKYRSVFSYPYFNLVQSNVIEDALYSDKSMVVCAPTGSGKTVVFEMAIVQLLMEIEDTHYTDDFKIIYMAPVKAICTERLTEWYPKFTRLGLLCIVITGDTDVDFSQLQPYSIIITTPEKWDMVTRRWREHRQLVEVIKLFLIDEVHILNDETRGPVLEAVVSRMKTIESSAQSAHRIEQLQNQYQGTETTFKESAPKIRFVAVSATVSNPQDVAAWLGTEKNPAVFYKFGDESRPVKLKRIVEGYPCPEGSSIFKFDIVLNYRLWSVIQKYHNGKPTLIFCNTRKSVMLTAETLSRELTVAFNPEQKAKLAALASTIKNKKLQALILSGVGCHHAGLLFEERTNIEHAFRNRDLPILITTTTLAMGVNLPAHLVIIKNTQQYVNGAYQEYSISTILQMVGRAGRPQYDTEATAVIMTRLCDKPRYEALVGGSEPLQSYLHKRLAENLNSEVALGTVNDVAQCVQWLRSTFLSVRAARDPKRYLGLPQAAPQQLITKKIEELCVKAMNGLATSGLITMDDASCIESTEAGRLMSVFYLDLETMKHIMKINGTETLERLLWIICESHELADMHLRVDERRCLNTLNRNNATATIRFPMKGKISSRQMKLNCIIQAILGCLNIPDPSLNQEAMKIMRIADRVCKCLVAYVTRPALVSQQPKHYSAVLNSLILAKCMAAHLWENSLFVSKQLRGIGPTFSTLLATAGKVNFMLLEESHPRDLERIMNKGPPAGNVLRKQVSLLPKYQLTMTPIDEKTVLIQLVLLNQNYLSENMENLTAGASHKSYLVVGDSENNLLLYNCFKDTDLISIYDGTITYQITRKYSYEHKVFANCISASFVGIDAQSEYLFKDIEPVLPAPYLSPNIDLSRRQANKQTVITDTFKERKRRNNSGNDITQSKEKKKRDGALLEKFKYLKESFGKSSKKLKEELNKSTVTSNKILEELTNLEKPKTNTVDLTERVNDNKTLVNNNIDKSSIQPVNTEEIDSDDFVDDEKINCILNEIENEISEENLDSNFPCVDLGAPKTTQKVQRSTLAKYFPIPLKEQQRNNSTDRQGTPSYNSRKRTPKNNKLNYNFIGLLEKENSLSDEEEKIVSDKTSGFSSTIKNQIEKYLQQTKIMSKEPDRSITELLKNDNSKVDRNNVVTEENTDFDVQRLTPTHTPARNFLRNLNVDFIQSQEKDLEQSSTTNNKKDEDIVKLAIDDEIRDINHIDAEGISYNKKPDEFNSHCAVELNTSLNYPIHSTNVTDKTDYLHDTNPKEKCLIPYNNYYSLIPHNTHRDAMNENTKINSSFRSIKDKATSIIALPHKPFQVLTRPENPLVQKQITCIENDMINSGSDLLINPDFRGPTCALNSNLNQFKASAEYNYDDYVNSSNHNVSVRKYAYSSTNIDISTRDDHLVVKKIKMDWNITEIISQEKKVSSSYWDIFPDDKTFNAENNTIELEPSQPYPLNSTSENNAKKKGEEIKKPAISYDRKKLKKDNTKNIQDSFTEKNDRPKITSPLSQCSLMCVQIEQMPSDSNTRVHDLRDNIANEEPIQMNLSPQKENKCIENILQKYSKIFKKNNAENLSQNLTQTKVVDRDLPNTPSEKPKRPFKITDIQNFNTPLPKTLISETFKRENVVKSIKSIPNIEDVPSKIQKDIKRNNEIEYVLQITPIQENFQKSPEIKESWIDFNKKCAISVKGVDSDNSGGELLKYESPIKDSEPQQTESMDIIDYNLDHSMMMMMNPKTLLQSLTKDEPELIVPPPSEFCDERDLNIPILDDNDDLTVPMDCYEPWDISCDETKEYIYQDDIDFMPRNEIETWALSQNSESYENFAASTSINKPGQSFTIMREPRQQISPFQNISVTRKRQNRLGQFKFCRKSKLPPKL